MTDFPSLIGEEGCKRNRDTNVYKKINKYSFISFVTLFFLTIARIPFVFMIFMSLCQFNEYNILWFIKYEKSALNTFYN
jgi:hypothetical protein